MKFDEEKRFPPLRPAQSRNLNLRQLLLDKSVSFTEGNNGWLNLTCPHCQDTGNHLGWSGKVFFCFRCGKHSRLDTLGKLLGIGLAETAQIIRKYPEGAISPSNALRGRLKRPAGLLWPPGIGAILPKHRKYLSDRGFDPERIVREYGISATGPTGTFKHRIIIPVFQNDRIVTYQGRDITGRAGAKYKSCPDNFAITPIKNTLYNLDRCQSDFVVVTEGPTKVWRLGPGSVATFGVIVTSTQIKLLKRFKHVFILFDDDEAGHKGADLLAKNLAAIRGRSCSVQVLWTVGVCDVADLSEKDAKELMRGITSL